MTIMMTYHTANIVQLDFVDGHKHGTSCYIIILSSPNKAKVKSIIPKEQEVSIKEKHKHRYCSQSVRVSREAVADAIVSPVLPMFSGNHHTTAGICLAHVDQLFEARREPRREMPTTYSHF